MNEYYAIRDLKGGYWAGQVYNEFKGALYAKKYDVPKSGKYPIDLINDIEYSIQYSPGWVEVIKIYGSR